MRKGLLALSILLILVFSFLIGMYIYKIATLEEPQDMEIAKVEKIEDECTLEYEHLEEIEQANAKEEKVSPNAKLTTNIYYDECGHTVKKTSNIENKYINLNKDELSEEYQDWEIKEFSPENIILYKEEKGICNEHYILKDNDGFIAVYSLDSNEKETLKEITEISTNFLPNTDIAKLQGGIKVYGRENLNSVLEDFE